MTLLWRRICRNLPLPISPDQADSGASNQFLIESKFPVSLRHTVFSHGWVYLEPWNWDESRQELSRPERIAFSSQCQLRVTQHAGRELSLVAVDGEQLGRHQFDFAERTVRRWLSIEWDPRPAIRVAGELDPDIAAFIESGGGRFLRCSTFYEDFVKTVCTIHATWASTRRMVSSLVSLLGAGTFPTPAQVADYGEDRLRKELRLGFRSRVLAESTLRMLDEGTIDEAGDLAGGKIAYEDLLGLRGVGGYTASHMMMLLGDFSRVPVDSEVTRFCKDRYGIEPKEVDSFFERWGQYRFLGYKLSRALSDHAE